MRIFLDQMFDEQVKSMLVKAGHDVVAARDAGLSRAADSEVLAASVKDRRVLVTLDEHFGDWALLPLSEHPGVVRLKVNPTTTANVLSLLLPFLERHGSLPLDNKLAIVRSDRRVRWVSTVQTTNLT